MTSDLLEAVYAAVQGNAASARSAIDVYAYCTAVIDNLQQRAGTIITDGHVVRAQPAEVPTGQLLLEISTEPYAAIVLTSADAQAQGLLRLWGDAVAKTWLQEHLARMGSLLEKLTGITEELWSAVQRDEKPLDMVCRRIVDALHGIDRVSIVLNAEDTELGTVTAAFPTDTVGQQIKLNEYAVFEQLRSSQQPIVIQDVQQADDVLGPNKGILAAFAIKSLLILPLTIERQLIGSIGFDAIGYPHFFTDREIALLQSVVRQIVMYMKTQRDTGTATPAADSARRQELIGAMVQDVPFRSDVESMLRTTAERVGRRLNATTVKLYLNRTPSEADFREAE